MSAKRSQPDSYLRILLCITIVIWAFSSTAHAGSSELLDEMFDMYLNVTPGQAFETQRRGGMTFGSVVTRNRIVRPNLIAYTPPSIQGGCGGIDLYGGSFSFINKDQLNQALRSIASNALSYAFTLALEGVCPTCMQKMEKLRDWVNEINKEMKDSCRWGKTLVNATGLDEWHNSRIEAARVKEEAAGTVDDAFDFLTDFASEKSSDRKTGNPTPVNAVWEALQTGNTATWFGAFGDNELREVLMSVTGTLVKSATDATGATCVNARGDEEYCYREFPPILTVKEFIDGEPDGTVPIYRCRDGHVNCLDPMAQDRHWAGFQERVREVLFGPPPTYTGGLVFKIRDKTATLTTEEAKFIEAAPIPVYTILKNVAKYPGTALTVGQQLQAVVAGQLARVLVFEMMASVRAAFGLNQVQMSEMMRQRLRERVREFETRQSLEQRELDNTYKLMRLVAQIAQQIVQQEVVSTSDIAVAKARK